MTLKFIIFDIPLKRKVLFNSGVEKPVNWFLIIVVDDENAKRCNNPSKGKHINISDNP
ncbi:MAG: hypothetical protein WKF36_10925 [Candidatus Nitrosocosmicus sp.]